jgi:SNF2 family DNA or RNA helicase
MIQLMSHQQRAGEIASTNPRYAFFWEPGAGKTIAVLSIVNERPMKTLVLAPKSILHSAWKRDADNFPNLNTVVVWTNKPGDRKKLIRSNAEVLVTNYETFRKHSGDFLEAGVRRLVVDESSKIKTFDSQITKACITFSDKMDEVYLLSGTPAPNNATEYWSQIRCLSSRTFGDSFYRFANSYFIPIKRRINGVDRTIGWKQNPTYAEEFHERLRSCSWSLKKSECLDLPEQTDVIRSVKLDIAERTAYESMLHELQVELAGIGTFNASAQGRLMKLRQLTGGLLYGKTSVEVIGTSKLDALTDLLDELAGHQVVIWAEFTAEIDRIARFLEQRSVSFSVIDGRTPLPSRTGAITAFQNKGLQYLIAHPAAAGHGITLTAACYDVFYSHSYSFETYEQARNRIHRKGQAEKVTHYHLLAEDSVDEHVWRALTTKQSAHESIMTMLGIELQPA